MQFGKKRFDAAASADVEHRTGRQTMTREVQGFNGDEYDAGYSSRYKLGA